MFVQFECVQAVLQGLVSDEMQLYQPIMQNNFIKAIWLQKYYIKSKNTLWIQNTIQLQ